MVQLRRITKKFFASCSSRSIRSAYLHIPSL